MMDNKAREFLKVSIRQFPQLANVSDIGKMNRWKITIRVREPVSALKMRQNSRTIIMLVFISIPPSASPASKGGGVCKLPFSRYVPSFDGQVKFANLEVTSNYSVLVYLGQYQAQQLETRFPASNT
jgi:hypothetical protein